MREGGGGQSRMKIHGEIRLTWWGGEEKMCDGVERTKEGRSGEGQGGRWGGWKTQGDIFSRSRALSKQQAGKPHLSSSPPRFIGSASRTKAL